MRAIFPLFKEEDYYICKVGKWSNYTFMIRCIHCDYVRFKRDGSICIKCGETNNQETYGVRERIDLWALKDPKWYHTNLMVCM